MHTVWVCDCIKYAFRRRVAIHGDFMGLVGSMAWLGFREGGEMRGTDTGDRMHLDGIQKCTAILWG